MFRSLWGLEQADLSQVIPDLEAKGFRGIEASLSDLGYYKDGGHLFCDLLIRYSMEFVCGLYTSWDDYEGCWQNLTVQQHLEQYKKQLLAVTRLKKKPVCINVHAGSDTFSLDEMTEFFEKAIELEKIVDGIPLGYETHRGRMFYSPWTTRQILVRFPSLKITLDLSHWVLVCERLLNSDFELEFIDSLVDRVVHVHARLGQAQAPQLPADSVTMNQKFSKEIAFFYSVWLKIRKFRGSKFTFTPEYGPEPYKPTNASFLNVSDWISIESKQLNDLFKL